MELFVPRNGGLWDDRCARSPRAARHRPGPGGRLEPPRSGGRAAPTATALKLSHGAGVLVQLATRGDDLADLRGPCELITPEVDDALDGAITDDAIGGLLLGQDFLQSVVVSLLGPARLV